MKSETNLMSNMNTGFAWKLIFLAVAVALCVIIYAQWGLFVASVVEWQKSLHTMLASHIRDVSEDVLKYGGAMVALSFGYGVFHAVGPGHGKAVIVTYLGTNKESIRKGIGISFSAAILQSLVAIVLVSALARLLKFKLAEVHNYGNDMALVSYALVILLGSMLVLSSINKLLKLRRSKLVANKSASGFDAHEHSHFYAHRHDHHHDHSHAHKHAPACGCSHAHVAEQNQSIWQTLTVILSMGFRPCSGAIVVLIYAHLVGAYSYGVIATLMMGLGTGLSVSLIAVVTLYARSWLERLASGSGDSNTHFHSELSHYLRFIGGVILVALGWSLYRAASVIASGHPLF